MLWGEHPGGPLAQLAEQRTFNPLVVGSSPTWPTAHGSEAWPPARRRAPRPVSAGRGARSFPGRCVPVRLPASSPCVCLRLPARTDGPSPPGAGREIRWTSWPQRVASSTVTPVLRTDRLLLDPYTPEDEEAFVALFQDTRVSRWMGDGPTTEAEDRALFGRVFTKVYAENLFDVWAVRRDGRAGRARRNQADRGRRRPRDHLRAGPGGLGIGPRHRDRGGDRRVRLRHPRPDRGARHGGRAQHGIPGPARPHRLHARPGRPGGRRLHHPRPDPAPPLSAGGPPQRGAPHPLGCGWGAGSCGV